MKKLEMPNWYLKMMKLEKTETFILIKQQYYCMKAIKIKILEYLLDNKENNNISTISKNIKTNYSNTYQNVLLMGEISLLKIGQNKLVFLKNILTPDIFTAENNRLNNFLKSEDIRNITRKLNKITSPFFIALLFGSRIKSKKFNDIDLCIITDDKKIISELENELDTLSYSIDLNTFTTDEFKEMISSKKSNLGNEILKKNIILKGIENYYGLLNCHQSDNEKLKDSSDESKKKT